MLRSGKSNSDNSNGNKCVADKELKEEKRSPLWMNADVFIRIYYYASGLIIGALTLAGGYIGSFKFDDPLDLKDCPLSDETFHNFFTFQMIFGLIMVVDHSTKTYLRFKSDWKFVERPKHGNLWIQFLLCSIFQPFFVIIWGFYAYNISRCVHTESNSDVLALLLVSCITLATVVAMRIGSIAVGNSTTVFPTTKKSFLFLA